VQHKQNTQKWLFEFVLAVAGYTTIGDRNRKFSSQSKKFRYDEYFEIFLKRKRAKCSFLLREENKFIGRNIFSLKSS
jgi:hypothetical protein